MPTQLSILPSPSPVADAGIKDIASTKEAEAEQQPSSKLFIQCKLSVGSSDDPLEKEADTMADTVMRMPEQNFIQRKCSHCEEEDKIQRQADDEEIEEGDEASGETFIQRKCSHCEEEEKVQREVDDDEEEIQRKPERPAMPFIQKKEDGTQVASDTVTAGITSSRGGGASMDDGTRSFMETRFGSSFEQVNIHTGSYATNLSRQLNAKAFTVGNDIYFNEGQYNTQSDSGKHLLAHELTHVIQQNGSMQRKSMVQCEEDDVLVEEPVFEPTDEEINNDDEGATVERYGVISNDEGANLWQDTDRTTKLGLLTLNNRVFVDRKVEGGWYAVYVDKHQLGEKPGVSEGTFGYVAENRVSTDMPDPDSWLYRIQKGEGALELATKVYKGKVKIEWGKDYRYLVNVLAAVNDAKGRRFLYKKDLDDSWSDAKTMMAGQIWVPGTQLVDAMHGQVSSGSISYEVLTTIADIAIGIGGFVVGLIEGLLMSIADIFVGIYDLIVMAKDIFVKIFNGTFISDAKEFFSDISKIKMSDIIDMLGAKWNHPDTWERWKFRGYVIGYGIMEVLLLVFSVGALTAVKWAGKVSKIGKLAEYISKMPKVVKFVEAAKAIKDARLEKIKAALKAAHALSEGHGWAAKALRIPAHILVRLSEMDISKLKKLPQYLRERFARLSERMMLWVLGCNSPCKVDLRKIEEALKILGKGGTALTDPDSVLKALKGLPQQINVKKISAKLRKKSSALMTAIKEAGITDSDFAKLADFLTTADMANPAEGYRTFVRYLTALVPARTGKDIKKLNAIEEAIVKAEKGRGAAMKGPIFEQWIALHIPQLADKNFRRIVFDVKTLLKKKIPPFTRSVDKWIPDEGAIWEIKHQFSKVPPDQLADYAGLLGKAAPDGNIVKSINYVFPTKAAAEINKEIASVHKWGLWYVDEATNALVRIVN